MTGNLFIDTAPVIYLIEENPKYFKQVSTFMAESLRQRKTLVTSVLTTAEFEIKPRKLEQPEVIDKFEKIVKPYFQIDNITWLIAEISSILRAKYKPLKAIDALQVACALKNKCEYFITNARRLKMIKEIPILLIKDL
jgi:predicted nucleic acid-binding protein